MLPAKIIRNIPAAGYDVTVLHGQNRQSDFSSQDISSRGESAV